MADDLIIATSAGGPTSSVPNATRFSLEEITTLNGAAVTAALVQRIIMALRTADGTAVDVTSATPLPVSMATGPLPSGAATESTLADVLAAVDAVFGAVDGLEGKDFATQTTLAEIEIHHGFEVTALEASAALLQGISTLLVALEGKDFASQTTLAAMLAKLIAAPATEAKQDDIITLLSAQALYLDGLEGLLTPASAATHSNVASSASSVTLVAADATRKGVTIFNDSTAILYIKFGATASATSCVQAMAAGSYYEVPAPFVRFRIDGIWSAVNGNARIGEAS